MKVLRPLLVLGLTLPVVACGPSNPTADSGPQNDAGPAGDDAGRTDAAMRPDAGPTNDSFEGARAVTTDGTAVTDAIEAPNDVDYWRFEGTAGDWIAINTTANPDDDPEMVDTVITLFDSTRTQIAENDDGLPRASTDSEIVIRLPSTGTYYIEVQEFSTWMPADPPAPEGRGSFTYELAVGTLTNTGAVNIDQEPGDDAATARALTFGGTSGGLAFAMGSFNDATDVDVYSFSVATMQQILSIDIMPAGADGYGSTRAAGRIWVTDMAGTEILARVEPRGMLQNDLSPTLVPGDYLLWVDAGGGTAGTNDHYVLKALLGTENPLENETVANSNDMTATATALTMEDDGMGTSRGFIIATLGAGDVDVFSFAVPAGRHINAYCGSQSVGSGVRGLQGVLLDSSSASVGMGTETATDGVAITDITPAAAGTYYLRLTPGTHDPEVTSSFVRCGVALTTPAP
ncbi:MAG: PPC domain-containing protein [Sandaracinaceae bacterium]|nr:PPC domain-containing protein [Sandaracinaceae bacterium]